jgi:hypothetical protein
VSTEEAGKVQAIIAEGVAREGLQELVLTAEESAAKRLADFVGDTAVDKMIADAKETGMPLLDGPGGLIGQLTARVIERALGAEMDEHLGYVKGDPAGNGSGNSRNGSFGKSVTTVSGPARISVPRDRNAEFEPQIVAKGQRRVGAVDDMILSLYSRGMTTRDIRAHIAEVYGAQVSPALVSAVTDVVADEITEWQNRPLDAFYAILYIDALVVKVRDGGAAATKAARLTAWSQVSMRTGSSMCWASGWAGPRDRGSGRACSPSSATAASRTSFSYAATGLTACPTRSRRPGRRRQCRPALFTLSGQR